MRTKCFATLYLIRPVRACYVVHIFAASATTFRSMQPTGSGALGPAERDRRRMKSDTQVSDITLQTPFRIAKQEEIRLGTF